MRYDKGKDKSEWDKGRDNDQSRSSRTMSHKEEEEEGGYQKVLSISYH